MQINNKQREALEQIRDMIMGGGFDGTSPARIVNICDAALAEPVRNYEVGTPKEQWKRFDEFCDAWQESAPVESCSDKCPVIKMKNLGYDGCQGRSGCYALWAQMPYEEGGAK